jgi:SAM-dependent methyltransferase
MINIKYCPVCKSEDIIIIKKIEYYYPKKAESIRDKKLMIAFEDVAKCDKGETLKFNLCECNNCHFIYLDPRFTNEEMLIKYTRFSNMKLGEIEKNVGEKDILKEKILYEYIERYAGAGAKTLLDFGGADGRMCIRARDKYDCEVIELSRYPMCEGIKYIGENLESCKGKKYDIILLVHVLEHMNKPLEFLLEIKKYLEKEKGIIIVSIPYGFRHGGYDNDPITHCNFFFPDSFMKIMEVAGYKSYKIGKSTFPKLKELYFVGGWNE